MKKKVLTIGAAVLFTLGTTSFIGCGNSENQETETHEHSEGEGHEHADGHSHEHASTSTDEKYENTAEYSGEKVKDLSLILQSYFELNNALATDNSQGAADAAKKMLSAFNGFDKTVLDASKTTEYAEIEESAVENADHISKNVDIIDHQREHLVVLSQDVNDLITLVGTNQKLYIDFCPMVNNNKGAIWISEAKEINNPYMGSKMPTCGKIQSEIN